jgi:dTDP-4-amino-4,6-dideoxygalactose transaminase
MNIPFFNYPEVFKSREQDFISVFKDVSNRGAFIMQDELKAFEAQIADYSNSKYAVGVSNATDGLQMAFMAGGILPGDEVIFCSHTMVATASAIHFSGGIPVPVEAARDHLIDPKEIERAISQKTKAICPTHLNGRTADMDQIQLIAMKYNLDIYEDAAQALGSKWKDRFAGTFGRASCISFYPAKILGCLGDGGAVLTDDDNIYQKLLLLRDHGRHNETGDVLVWGFNARLDNLQAAFLSMQFEDYQNVIDRRREIALKYQDRLEDIEELVLPPGPNLQSYNFDVYQNYEIEAKDRDSLRDHLKDQGIGTLIQWGGKAVHQFRHLGFTQSLPITEKLFDRILMLPINMSLTDPEVDFICNVVEEFYSN